MAVVLSFLMLTFSIVANAGCQNTNKVSDIRSKCKTYCVNNYGVTNAPNVNTTVKIIMIMGYHTLFHNNFV